MKYCQDWLTNTYVHTSWSVIDVYLNWLTNIYVRNSWLIHLRAQFLTKRDSTSIMKTITSSNISSLLPTETRENLYIFPNTKSTPVRKKWKVMPESNVCLSGSHINSNFQHFCGLHWNGQVRTTTNQDKNRWVSHTSSFTAADFGEAECELIPILFHVRCEALLFVRRPAGIQTATARYGAGIPTRVMVSEEACQRNHATPQRTRRTMLSQEDPLHWCLSKVPLAPEIHKSKVTYRHHFHAGVSQGDGQ